MMAPTWTSPCGTVQLYLGDCRDLLADLSQRPALVVTDPPYESLNVEVSVGTTTQLVGLDQFAGKRLAQLGGTQWFCTLPANEIREMIATWQGLVGPGGAVYVFSDVKSGLVLLGGARNVLVWDKGKIGMGYAWRRMHEWIGYFPGSSHRLRRKDFGDILRVPGIQTKTHPTEKPAAVMEPIVLNSSDSGEVVLDPFMGVAPVGVAAVRLSRRFIGIEIDPRYFEIAKARIQEALVMAEGGPLFVQQQGDLFTGTQDE